MKLSTAILVASKALLSIVQIKIVRNTVKPCTTTLLGGGL